MEANRRKKRDIWWKWRNGRKQITTGKQIDGGRKTYDENEEIEGKKIICKQTDGETNTHEEKTRISKENKKEKRCNPNLFLSNNNHLKYKTKRGKKQKEREKEKENNNANKTFWGRST